MGQLETKYTFIKLKKDTYERICRFVYLFVIFIGIITVIVFVMIKVVVFC